MIQPSNKYISDLKDNRITLKTFKKDEENLKSLEQRLRKIDDLIRYFQMTQ